MHFTTAVVLAFAAIFATAAPSAPCGNQGQLACCNSFQDSQSLSKDEIFSIGQALGLSSLSGQVGAACSPIEGTSGAVSCNAQSACCSNVSMNGGVAAGCGPVLLSGI